MDANTQTMDANVQRMESQMDANMQMLKAGQEEMKAELVKVKGEMQAMDWKMAPVRGGTTESRGGVEVWRTAVETGEVEGTSDAAIVKSETDKLEQGMTEIITETQDLEIVTGTQGERERGKDELHEIKEEHTHT